MSAMLVFALMWTLSSCRCGESSGGEQTDSAVVEVDSAPPLKARPRPDLEPSKLESIELITGGASADEPLPLVVALHGLGDEPANFSELFKAFDRKARFIIPRGPLPQEKGYAWMQPTGPSNEVAPVIQRSADRVASLIDEMTESKPTKGKAIVTGFSQGGVIAFMVAARQPERIGAAVPVAGWLPQFAWPDEARFVGNSPVVRALNGETDEIVKALDVRRCIVKLRMLKVDATVRLYKGVGHSLSSNMRRDLFATLTALVEGSFLPDPCNPCSTDSMDPDACSLCEGGEVDGETKTKSPALRAEKTQ